MTKFKFLLLGTSLSFIPLTINAQCVAMQDCATLGYTETSCNGGKGVKCPFGNKWACLGANEEECLKIACEKLDFKYDCTGDGYTGGAGKNCSGKYAQCNCASGYEWKDSKCMPINKCVVGALYYSDGTCSEDKLYDKTLLGVIIYTDETSNKGWIMTVDPIAKDVAWPENYNDVPKLKNNKSAPNDIQDSCTNTDIITKYGDSSKYPEAWAAGNYKPTGTPENKVWCLPSAGLLKKINASTLSKINAGIIIAEGTLLGSIHSGHFEEIWSSSEDSYGHPWYLSISNDSCSMVGYSESRNYYWASVRPVMEF